MGITVSPASSSGGGGGSSGTLPVVPGTAVTREIYTDTGFTTGDYVYRYGTGSVGSAPNSGSYPAISFPLYNPATNAFASQVAFSISYTKAGITAPQVIPSGTYTGSTYTYGSVFQAEQTLRAENTSQGPRITRLPNGNLVAVYNGNSTSGTAQTLYYRIFSNDNTQVAAGTVATDLTTNTASYGPHYDVCTTSSGGFAVVYIRAAGPLGITTYTDTGTVVLSTTSATAGSIAYYPRIKQAGTNFYVVGTNNPTTGGYGSEVNRYNSSLVYQNSYAFGAGSYNNFGPLTIDVFPDNRILLTMNYVDGGQVLRYVILDNALTVLYGPSNTGSSLGTPGFATVPTVSGGILAFGINSSNQLYAVYIVSNSVTSYANTFASVNGQNPYRVAAAPYAGPVDGSMSSTNNTSMCVYFLNTAATNYVSRIINYNVSGNTWSSSSANISTGLTGGIEDPQAIQTTQSANCLVYGASGTPQPRYTLFANVNLTSGASYAAPLTSVPTPANGYYLLGVATTTAAAGTTGTIAINGQVNLSASYATSATPIGFDYNPRNVGGFPNGNKGYVVNRVVTLTGLE